MAYDPSLSTSKDQLRFMLGDIDTAELLPDATYSAVLTQHGDNVRLAAIALANALISRFAHLPSSVDNTGGAKVTWANRLAGWQTLVTRLQAEIAAEVAAIAPTPAPVSSRVRVKAVW